MSHELAVVTTELLAGGMRTNAHTAESASVFCPMSALSSLHVGNWSQKLRQYLYFVLVKQVN